MSSSVRIESEQGFTVALLSNGNVEVAVVPALGAKLISLRALPAGREWLWRPPGALKLFANKCGDTFGDSTLIGADECIPTIAACGNLPDHGEAWSQSWSLDDADDIIRTSLRLPVSPFTISRSISLSGHSVVLDYELFNHSDSREAYLWALHPLLAFHEGDRLLVPDKVSEVRVEGATFPGKVWEWPSPAAGINLEELRLESDHATAKFFAHTAGEGRAGIENPTTGDRLELRWSAAENPFFGVWLTRGGWRGIHHVAIEPTNVPFDSLADALENSTPELFIAAGETRRWQVVLNPTSAVI